MISFGKGGIKKKVQYYIINIHRKQKGGSKPALKWKEYCKICNVEDSKPEVGNIYWKWEAMKVMKASFSSKTETWSKS